MTTTNGNQAGLFGPVPAPLIVKVQFLADSESGYRREYTYYSAIADLKVGQVVICPTKNGSARARVTATGIGPALIEKFKAAMRTIPEGARCWNCPKNCLFGVPGGNMLTDFDNPEPGGCAMEHKLEAGSTYEPNEKYPICVMYSAPTGAPPIKSQSGNLDSVIQQQAAIQGPAVTHLIQEAAKAQELFGDEALEKELFGSGPELTPKEAATKATIEAMKAPPAPVAEGPAITPVPEQVTEVLSRVDPMATTAVIMIAPRADEAVTKLYAEGVRLRDYAVARVIGSNADLTPATEDLSLIAKVLKGIKAKQDAYQGPIEAHLKAVRAAFTEFIAPLVEADSVTRDKMKAFNRAQEAKIAEAAQLEAEAAALARRQAAASGTGEFTVNTAPIPAPLPAPKTVRVGGGTAGFSKVRKYRIVDFAKLDDTYKLENKAMLNAAAKSGVKELAGVEFYLEDSVRVTTK
jgi:hypothetical protein